MPDGDRCRVREWEPLYVLPPRVAVSDAARAHTSSSQRLHATSRAAYVHVHFCVNILRLWCLTIDILDCVSAFLIFARFRWSHLGNASVHGVNV